MGGSLGFLRISRVLSETSLRVWISGGSLRVRKSNTSRVLLRLFAAPLLGVVCKVCCSNGFISDNG